MPKSAVSPPAVMPSIYGPEPRRIRPAQMPEMVSLPVSGLFPEMPKGFTQGVGVDRIHQAAKNALADVDMRMIKPNDTVNILCSEHGFYILEGLHYREMLKALGDAVFDRTNCRNILYVMASGMGIKETDEVIDWFDLKRYFNCPIKTTHPFDTAVSIETEIGTLYGLKKVYDADWIIHAPHDEPRDLYFHRMMNRCLKAFAMNYARYETRAVFHGNFSNRSANFLQKAIFDAPFVQDRFAFACILRSTPNGIIGVDADNDLYRLNRRITKDLLKHYGKVLRLMGEIDECIAVWDAGRWGYYIHAGGIAFGCLENAAYDAFDLEIPSAMGFHDTLEKYFSGEIKALDAIMNINPAIKAVVVNQAWPGLPISDIPKHVPTIVVGRDQADLLCRDSTNPHFMDHAVIADTLLTAMDFARKITGTDKAIVFDGSFGHFTVSRSLAELLAEKAALVAEKVERHYLPLWLTQRGWA
ncbi:MAG: hypothetical protein R6U50_07560 [Desulfobacterales bacterium]